MGQWGNRVIDDESDYPVESSPPPRTPGEFGFALLISVSAVSSAVEILANDYYSTGISPLSGRLIFHVRWQVGHRYVIVRMPFPTTVDVGTPLTSSQTGHIDPRRSEWLAPVLSLIELGVE